MRKESLNDYRREGASSTKAAMQAFETHWRAFLTAGCAWARVQRITALTQARSGWTVKYRIEEATITQAIRPALALELLDNDVVGYTLDSVWFIINPERVEEIVTLDLDSST